MTNPLLSLPTLSREEMTPPVIRPVPPGIQRPRWSVMIPTFNCARFLRETLESVLSQDIDPTEMQIEVIDDCSTTDDPEAVVRDYGRGRVSFYRKPVNAGAVNNFNTCIERSIGHYVHILHGDDFVKPGFYQTIEERANECSDQIHLFIVRCLIVDELGALDSLSPRIKELEAPSSDPSCMFLVNSARTPGCVITRSFYEQHGGFLTSLVHTADWEMWVRALAFGKGVFINEILAVYRFFEGNDTGRLARAGDNILDYYRLSQVLTYRYPSYPRLQFVQDMIGAAAGQAAGFQNIGEKDASEANRNLMLALKQLTPNERQSLVRRVLRRAISILGTQ